MSVVDILLLPFVFIYKGFVTVLLLPYYLVKGVMGVGGSSSAQKEAKFKIDTKTEIKDGKLVKTVKQVHNPENAALLTAKKQETVSSAKEFNGVEQQIKPVVMPEIKQGEEIKVINQVRSAYSKPVTPPKETDPVKIAAVKKEKTLKQQKEFERLVAKAREEEAKRAREMEAIRAEREKKEQERKAKELEKAKREQIEEEEYEKRIQERIKNGEPVTFGDKITAFFKKLNHNPKEELELEAKKTVLDEQFKDKKNAANRMDKALVFDYIARNPKGQLEKSSIEALSRVDVHSFLEAEGYEVYDITIAKSSNVNLIAFKMKKSKLIFYLSQLSAYLKSGIALAEAVKIIENQAKNTNEKKAWRAVYYDLSMGDVLSSALEKRKEVFPKLLINMIKTAEMTGNLTETLDDMVEYYTESEQTKKQMKSAMMYPTVVTLFAVAVVTFILMWVVPQFVAIYADMDSELPTITKIVIAISDFIKSYLIIIIVIFIVLVLILSYMYKNVKSFRRSLQQFAMNLPVFGNIIIYNEVTVFTKTFANLINHNVFITDTIDVLSKITDNEIYKRLIFETSRNLTKGESISKAFEGHWAFPDIAYQMLITGEKTGRLGPMMEKVSDYYQEQHRNIINQMKSLIEPALIVSLALIVGGILLSVIIPMFAMYDNL